jgi:hypothetical protein
MTKEAKELIAKQKKPFIKINTTALNDIENVSIDCHLALSIIVNLIALLQELNKSNKKKSNKKKSNKRKVGVY